MHISRHARLPRYALYDEYDRLVSDIGDHESATITWKWGSEIGTGTLTISGQPDLEVWSRALRVHEVPLFVSVYTPMPFPWTGRVTDAEYVDDGDGPALELTLINDKVWAEAILLVPNPQNPAEYQDRLDDVRSGPLASVVKRYLADAAGRVHAPVAVVPPASEDPSPVVEFSARMDNALELFGPELDRAGYSIRAYTYREGDPLPDGMSFTPAVGTVILDVVEGRDNESLVWQEEHLQTYSVASSEPQAYRAYVGLEGSGEERTYMEVVDNDRLAASNGKALPEIFVDSSGEKSDPEADGRRALAETGGLSVTFTVADGHPWLVGDEWREGDMAHARIGGQLFPARIVEVTMSDESDGKVTFTPTCGTTALSRPEAVADAVARLVAGMRTLNARR